MTKTITLHPSRIGCPSIPGTMKGIVSSIAGVADVRDVIEAVTKVVTAFRS